MKLITMTLPFIQYSKEHVRLIMSSTIDNYYKSKDYHPEDHGEILQNIFPCEERGLIH